MNEKLSIKIAKKKLEKAIVNELYKNGMLDFSQSNSILKILDKDINALEEKLELGEDMTNMIVKIPL